MTTHLLPAKKKITEDDATIARMLEHASAPALLMSIIHLTGDTRLLQGDIRPQKAVINDFVSGLTEDEQRRVRAMALEALKAYRDRGCTLPPPPSRETIHAMMNFIAGEPVSDDNVPLMLEELARGVLALGPRLHGQLRAVSLSCRAETWNRAVRVPCSRSLRIPPFAQASSWHRRHRTS